MKKKKLLGLFLAASMVLSMTACGGNGDTGSAPEKEKEESGTSESAEGSGEAQADQADDASAEGAGEAEGNGSSDPFGRYEEPLEIHFVRSTDDTIETNVLANLPGQTLEDNFWLDTYEEELGIKIVYDWIVKGDDEFNQKMNVSMASEDLPDVMCVTATQMMQLVDAGLVQEMGSVFDEYAADFTKEVMNQEGEAPFLAGSKHGF